MKTTQTKYDLQKKLDHLQGQYDKLLARFETGRYKSWGKTYMGIQLHAKVEAVVKELMPELLRDQYQGEYGENLFMVIEDGIHNPTILPGVTHYIVQYSASEMDGTVFHNAWQAIEVD